jgi:hypothetical protein
VRDRDVTPEGTPDAQRSRAYAVATPDDDEAPARGFREGLPAGYRSRHERHYVEELTADPQGYPVRPLPGGPHRAQATHLATPIEVDDPIDGRTSRILGELQDAVASMQAALQQMAPPAQMRDRVAWQLLAAEATRADWLLRARHYLGSSRPVAHVPVRGAALMGDVTRTAGAVIALRGGSLQAQAGRGSLVVHGDRRLLATAVIGLAWALFAVGEQVVQDARVDVRLAPCPGGGPLLAVTQPSAVLMHRALSRFFDPGWTERPGGATAELAVQLAGHAAALHGARLDVSSRPGVGTRVTMAFLS